MRPRRVLACFMVVACGHEAQPGAPDASTNDDPDLVAPSIVAIEPASDVWLREPVRFVFDEPIDISRANVTATLAGEPIETSLALDGDRAIAVTVSTVGVGPLAVTLDGLVRDFAGNKAQLPVSVERMAPAWSRTTLPDVEEAPAIAIGNGTYAAWRTGSPKHVVVWHFVNGAWHQHGGPIGTSETSSVAIAADDSHRPVVAWIEGNAAHVARWQYGAWHELPTPGSGTHVALASTTRIAVLGATAQVRELVDDAWTPIADHPVTGTIVGTPSFSENSIGWIENAGAYRIRVYSNGVAMAPIVVDAASRMTLAADASRTAIAWDEAGPSRNVVVAIANGADWTRLGGPLDVDVAGDAFAPAIALDGEPIVAWRERIEMAERGVVARWTGAAWTIVGGQQWAIGAASAPAIALRGGAPAIASVTDGTLHLARFNGPALAGIGMERKSIAGCNFDPANPPATFKATGCFDHPGLVPYDIVNELWSDGTKKRRFIALRDGTSMTALANESWTGPTGTFIIKEFAIETTPGNPATRRPVETRVLARTASGWSGFSYQWRANGTDADLLNDGQYTADWPLSTGATYRHLYPSRSQCLSCHHGSYGPLLGLRGPQLARWFDYDGTIADQAATLAAIAAGPATGAAPFVSTHDRSASQYQRTRSYMAANCAHCHNPNNIAIKDLRYTTPLADSRLCEVIVPGAPASSTLYARVTSRPGMPALGTLVVDPLAQNLVGGWIAAMTSCP
jgi:hypothetical protein